MIANLPALLKSRSVARRRHLDMAACAVIAALAFFPLVLPAQKAELAQGPYRLEIVLEKMGADGWLRVDPGLVFEPHDRIRFRVTSNFDGYLYVMNLGTSGDYTQLFPREDTGQENRIEASREYLVPATEGAFRITGPGGHEIVYWMVSPVELAPGGGYQPLPPPPAPGKVPANLLPRCDETILRARGDCIDTSAGAQAIPDQEKLPENLAQVPNMESRQLLFLKKKDSSVVSAPPTAQGPVIFEFRIAHK